MSTTIDTIAESLDKLTVLEAVELRKLLEERWDVRRGFERHGLVVERGVRAGDQGATERNIQQIAH